MTNDERETFERLFNASKAEDAEIMKAMHEDKNVKLQVQQLRNKGLRDHLKKQFPCIPGAGNMYRIVPVEPLHITLDREYLEMNYLYCNTGGYDI